VNPSGWKESNRGEWASKGDSGSAARFFYCPKASKADRDEGCEGLEEVASACNLRQAGGLPKASSEFRVRNHHPTVKPTALMRYLCRLVTPPGGIVLDPFMGSGSTGKAAMLEGFRFIGIEREAEYVEIARARIAAVATVATVYALPDAAYALPFTKIVSGSTNSDCAATVVVKS
jgi:site-specific DNA-methyltransferase (adenine-specific)